MTGSGITTTLIAIIANARQEDQAVATAGRRHLTLFPENYLKRFFPVSYLFRSLGSVVGLSVGSTLVQATLRYLLRLRLSGDDAQEVSKIYGYFSTLFLTILRKDCKTRPRIPRLLESTGSPY